MPVCSTLPHSRCSSLLPLPSVFLSLSLALFQDCASPHKSSRGVSQTFCSAVAPRLLPSTPPLHSETKSPLSLVLTIHWSCFDCSAKRFAAFSSSFVISEAVKLFVFHFFYTRLPSIRGLLFIRQLILALNGPLFGVGSTHRA